MREEPFIGGNISDATRVGDTVRRRAGPWSPAVHALLRHLASVGFEAPRVLGIDERGREILALVEGQTHSGWPDPIPPWVYEDGSLADAARLLRRYHDALAGFTPPQGAAWRFVSREPAETICHNDWSPWNAVFRDHRLAVMLDWDMASPGPRLWDIAGAAHSWVPLGANKDVHPDVAVRARRLRGFCDAYGLEDRAGLVAAMRERLDLAGRFIEEQARLGDPGMRKLAQWDVPRRMTETEVAYIDSHREVLENALR